MRSREIDFHYSGKQMASKFVTFVTLQQYVKF